MLDFWKMVYQENTHVIVMTTKEMERGRVRPALEAAALYFRLLYRNCSDHEFRAQSALILLVGGLQILHITAAFFAPESATLHILVFCRL